MHRLIATSLVVSAALTPAIVAEDLTRTPGFEHYEPHVRAFLKKHEIPGAAFAVSYRGRVVFAKGYGVSNRETQAPVTAQSRFRIASVSKPITAVAVLQLVERGQLGLEDKIGSHLPTRRLPEAQATDPPDDLWREVTVRHLLQHRGGWDRRSSFDPMFQSIRFAKQLGTTPPADAWTVIRAMRDQPLDFVPGERYAYSNFGYCLLGRIVEQVSEQSYETYVREHVLSPLGIDMRIGTTRYSNTALGEVTYYHQGLQPSVFDDQDEAPVPSPYGAWYLEAMDAHGGWVASAIDLAKFAAAFDRPDSCPLLRPATIRTMHARPAGLAGWREDGTPREPFYSLGWMNRTTGPGKAHHWHNGSLPGTTAILIRRDDGKNLVALLNTRQSPQTTRLASEVDRLLHRLVDAVPRWPTECQPVPQTNGD